VQARDEALARMPGSTLGKPAQLVAERVLVRVRGQEDVEHLDGPTNPGSAPRLRAVAGEKQAGVIAAGGKSLVEERYEVADVVGHDRAALLRSARDHLGVT
jgi:hypothetical protein